VQKYAEVYPVIIQHWRIQGPGDMAPKSPMKFLVL